MTSDEVRSIPLAFHRRILALLANYEKTLNLHRIVMSVQEDFEEGIRWAEALGFEREGLMRKHGPTKLNHYLYARVR